MKHFFCAAMVLLMSFGCLQAAEVPFVELKGHTAWVSFAVYTPDGKKIITSSWDDTIRIWDAESGSANFGKELKKLGISHQSIQSDAFSPDRKRMVITHRNAQILDTESGEKLLTLRVREAEGNSVSGAFFSPDGKKIVTEIWSSEDMLTARIWDAELGIELHRLAVPNFSVYRGTFSQDGKKIVMNIEDKTARIWDVKTGKELHKLSEQLGGINDAVFSPDSKKILTVSGPNGWADSIARIWDVESGKELKTLKGAEGFIVFSPDGTKIVTGGTKHTAIIWDAESGKKLYTLQGNPDSRANVGLYMVSLVSYDPKVSSVTFSPDGKRVVTASNDGSVRIWILEP
ncbi:MAG: WD40 repeat domain-containing protein [Planctomycetaceae bacterium]|nr:WD40 repeat domain-containing protein [Planctomycetaceae bacterium]